MSESPRGGTYRRGSIALLVAAAIGTGHAAGAEDSPPPAPPPPAAPAIAAAEPAAPQRPEEALEDRLRRMEAANERLLQRFEGVAKQNEELSRTVQDLSSQLKATRDRTPPPASAPASGSGSDPAGGRLSTGDPSRDASDLLAPGMEGDITRSPLTGGIGFPSTSAAVKPGKDRVPLTAFNALSYRNRYGFVLQSENEEFELRVNGLVQFDSRNYTQANQTPVINDIDMPRVRMWFSGRLTKPLEYQISFQRSTNSFDILNAYLNIHFDDRFQVRAGRFRAPYTYEWAKLSIWELPTPERSPFAINFGPNRQVGAMAWGNVLKNRVEYAAGLFDGPRNSYQDFNSAKDIMAFLDARPFFRDGSDSPLNFLSLGGSVDAGLQNNPISPNLLRGSITSSSNTLTTGSGDSIVAVPFLAFNNNVRERGQRALWELHATYFYKRLALLAAWDAGFNDFSLTTPGATPIHLPVSGYFAQASYMLTGETRDKITLVNPLRPFNLSRGNFGLGAIELQARYSDLTVGKQVFTQGLADGNLWTDRADFLDVGFNWYFNRYVKFQFDWQHAMFAQPVYYRPGGLQSTSDLIWLRLQLYF